MQFTVEYPIHSAGYSAQFLAPSTVTTFAQTAERAGFGALAFTEHPAPSGKWLEHGGHESFDPLTALAFCAAGTTDLRLMTYLLVLPYRNPLLAAKQIATVDVLSGGRLVVAVGSGYLRSEFGALGVDFDQRNELLDEALDVISRVWCGDELAFEGRHFAARGQVSVPGPVQTPHPPIWVGGNSRRARRRVAAHGQGWTPLMVDEQMTATTRTATIDSVATLAEAIADLRVLVEEAGRDPGSIDVQVQWPLFGSLDGDPGRALDALHELEKAGVTWVVLTPPADDVDRCLDALDSYGESVIAHAGSLG